MLRNIGLKNFKCWQTLDIDLAPITLFFGTNSSGKTAILQSLLMLKQTARGFDPKQHINFGGSDRDYVDLGSYFDLANGHDEQRNVCLKISWDLSHEDIEDLAITRWVEDKSDERGLYPSMFMQYDVSWGLDSNVFVKRLGYDLFEDGRQENRIELTYNHEDRYNLTRYVHDVAGEHSESMQGSANIVAAETVEVGPPQDCHFIERGLIFSIANGQVTTGSDFIGMQLGKLLNKVFYLGPLRQVPKRTYRWTGEKKNHVVEPDGADTIGALVSSVRDDGSLHDQVADCLTMLRLADALAVRPVDPNNRVYEAVVTVNGVESAIADVGFGVSQVLPVITMLLSAPEGSIVLLEQPELHLHPGAQSALADLLLFAAEQRNLQLIVESHSEHILRRLQRRVAEAQPEFAKPANIKMYFCETGQEGSSISEVEIDRFGQIANWPENFLGDISGDLHEMLRVALERRGLELERVGHRG